MSAWTTERPNKEGWWWYRNDAMPQSVVQVYERLGEGFYMLGPEVEHCRIADIDSDEEWSNSEWQPVEPAKE